MINVYEMPDGKAPVPIGESEHDLGVWRGAPASAMAIVADSLSLSDKEFDGYSIFSNDIKVFCLGQKFDQVLKPIGNEKHKSNASFKP